MEQSSDWQQRLTRVLNHPQFHASSDQHRLEVLQEALRQSQLPIQEFNEVLIRIWRTSHRIPQLTSNQQLLYLPAKRAYISPREVFVYRGSPEESQDIRLLEDIEKFVWEEFNYETEALLRPLNDLVKEIQRRIADWQESPTPLRRIDHVESTENWKRRFNSTAIIVKRNRQCRNREDPWDETPIIGIIESEYLHLSNGMCWHVHSFMEYVRGVNGVNDASGLAGYVSPRIWETEDLERIFNHPLIKAAGFDVWLKRILSASSYEQVTLETLDQLYRLASIFVSRGNPFHRELQRAVTPALYKAYWQYAKGNSDELFKIPDSEGQAVIRDTIKNKLKLEAFEHFMDYYETLSAGEKSGLELIYPGFERDLSFCDVGRLCVFVLAETAYTIYTRLAQLKDIEPLKLDVSER
jgi:hypothetical protein